MFRTKIFLFVRPKQVLQTDGQTRVCPRNLSDGRTDTNPFCPKNFSDQNVPVRPYEIAFSYGRTDKVGWLHWMLFGLMFFQSFKSETNKKSN